MNTIIKGTTPTIKYTLHAVDPADIAVAYLTIESGGEKLERDLTSATVDTENKFLCWTLTQAETLAFGDKINVECVWRLEDGTRGSSGIKMFLIDRTTKEVVI